MPTATVDAVDLGHELTGSGPRALLLNGSGATRERSAPRRSLVGPPTGAGW